MVEFSVRDARRQEAQWIMETVRQMSLDMVRYGGRAPATDETAWDKFADEISEELTEDKSKYLVAETRGCDRIGLAAVSIFALGGPFAPKKIVHLRVAYVQPNFRGAGVGTKLIADALDWGCRMGGDCCDLNVLRGNQAISLYKKLGFAEVAVSLTKPLKNH
jgi:ribosomal protein S18 acetylase RimI-like enzyme